jgi:hypothetical protein
MVVLQNLICNLVTGVHDLDQRLFKSDMENARWPGIFRDEFDGRHSIQRQ